MAGQGLGSYLADNEYAGDCLLAAMVERLFELDHDACFISR